MEWQKPPDKNVFANSSSFCNNLRVRYYDDSGSTTNTTVNATGLNCVSIFLVTGFSIGKKISWKSWNLDANYLKNQTESHDILVLFETRWPWKCNLESQETLTPSKNLSSIHTHRRYWHRELHAAETSNGVLLHRKYMYVCVCVLS